MKRALATTLLLTCTALLLGIAGCPNDPLPPRLLDAIVFTPPSVNFDVSVLPVLVQVWNKNIDLGGLTISVGSDQEWITATPASVISTGPEDKQTVTLTVNRLRLAQGNHQGSVTFRAQGIQPKSIGVSARQETDGRLANLNILNPSVNYSAPYLIDFFFSLKDADNESVIAEPAQFQVLAQEGNSPVVDPSTVHLKRGAARQLKVSLVLDYSNNMQNIANAISTMESAVKSVFLANDRLNRDAQVNIVEFHVDDLPPAIVADYTIDRAYLRNRLDAIQPEFVQGFYSGARVWDGLYTSTQTFDVANPNQEARYIILFSDGRDTSSQRTVNDAVQAALQRGIRIYAIGFGPNVSLTSMLDITNRTGGAYFPATSLNDLVGAFNQIIRDLDGQYVLRLASLSRDNAGFLPGFTIQFGVDGANYKATQSFSPPQYAGDVRAGKLRMVQTNNTQSSTVFLRADYVPRFISRICLFVRSGFDYDVSIVEPTDDGILPGWTMSVTPDPANDGDWYDLRSQGGPIPFATFGPMLQFSFDVLEDTSTLLSRIFIENRIYTNSQSFAVEGFTNTHPSPDQIGPHFP